MAEELTRAGLRAALDQEHGLLLDLIPRFDDTQWRSTIRADGWTPQDVAAHLADSTYGLALMALGEIQPVMPINPETGWMDVDDYNEQRRAKNAGLPREKIVARLSSAFDHARRAIDQVDDLDAPGPLGPDYSKGMWLNRIVTHLEEHRHDLEQGLAALTQASA